ncbi:MAG: hypothetical protein WKF75_06770 [Singulisphaera sp.]
MSAIELPVIADHPTMGASRDVAGRAPRWPGPSPARSASID